MSDSSNVLVSIFSIGRLCYFFFLLPSNINISISRIPAPSRGRHCSSGLVDLNTPSFLLYESVHAFLLQTADETMRYESW